MTPHFEPDPERDRKYVLRYPNRDHDRFSCLDEMSVAQIDAIVNPLGFKHRTKYEGDADGQYIFFNELNVKLEVWSSLNEGWLSFYCGLIWSSLGGFRFPNPNFESFVNEMNAFAKRNGGK